MDVSQLKLAEYEDTFMKGTIVEVSSEDSGLRGSWYTATVIRAISKKTLKLFVEYHNLFSDTSGSKPLREFVDGVLVRPIPPRVDPATRVFEVMEDVDAFHNDGWWEGVVTRVVIENGGKRRYSVFFRCSREQIDFYASDLRLHREWIRRDVWVPPLEGGGGNGRHSASGQKRKNGDDRGDGRGGGRAGNGKDKVARNGQLRDGGSRSTGRSPRKQGGEVNNNRGGREANKNSNRSVNIGAVMSKGKRVTRNAVFASNGNLKEPRRRAENHAGRRISAK